MRRLLNSLNGWQRLFVLIAAFWLPVCLSIDVGLPDKFEDMPKHVRSDLATEEIEILIPRKPNNFGGRPALALLENSDYQNANQATKNVLFETIVATDDAFLRANRQTKDAIAARFGIRAVQVEGRPWNQYPDQDLVRRITNEVRATAVSHDSPWWAAPLVYTMDDQTRITSYGSEAEVREAYAIVLKKFQREYPQEVATAIARIAGIFFIPLIILYGFGLLVGWVYSGFASTRKGF
jgi:hypothetical protein